MIRRDCGKTAQRLETKIVTKTARCGKIRKSIGSSGVRGVELPVTPSDLTPTPQQNVESLEVLADLSTRPQQVTDSVPTAADHDSRSNGDQSVSSRHIGRRPASSPPPGSTANRWGPAPKAPSRPTNPPASQRRGRPSARTIRWLASRSG